MSFVSSPPPCALTAQPLTGDEAVAGEINTLWADAPERETDLWPCALRLTTLGVLSLGSWGLLLGLVYALRGALG
jgi:hypothetical protein